MQHEKTITIDGHDLIFWQADHQRPWLRFGPTHTDKHGRQAPQFRTTWGEHGRVSMGRTKGRPGWHVGNAATDRWTDEFDDAGSAIATALKIKAKAFNAFADRVQAELVLFEREAAAEFKRHAAANAQRAIEWSELGTCVTPPYPADEHEATTIPDTVLSGAGDALQRAAELCERLAGSSLVGTIAGDRYRKAGERARRAFRILADQED